MSEMKPLRNHLGHTEEQVDAYWEKRRAEENAARYAVVIYLPAKPKPERA